MAGTQLEYGLQDVELLETAGHPATCGEPRISPRATRHGERRGVEIAFA